jgi:hypothetical protein
MPVLLFAIFLRCACFRRLYHARSPHCTHGYIIRNATVAQYLVDQVGHDVVKAIDEVMKYVVLRKKAELPVYAMLPPPVTQIWRTGTVRQPPT